MSTYLELQNRINDDYLNRSIFGTQTKRAIRAAIRRYERNRWNFNETSTALTTSAGQSYLSLPSNLLILDDIRVTVNGEDLPLNRRTPAWIRDANTGAPENQPTDYALYQNRVELFSVPNSAYSASVYYVKRLATLSADADTNAWTEDLMEDLIVYHATKLMWANVLRNETEAVKYAALERTALSSALEYHEQFKFHALRPTRF